MNKNEKAILKKIEDAINKTQILLDCFKDSAQHSLKELIESSVTIAENFNAGSRFKELHKNYIKASAESSVKQLSDLGVELESSLNDFLCVLKKGYRDIVFKILRGLINTELIELAILEYLELKEFECELRSDGDGVIWGENLRDYKSALGEDLINRLYSDCENELFVVTPDVFYNALYKVYNGVLITMLSRGLLLQKSNVHLKIGDRNELRVGDSKYKNVQQITPLGRNYLTRLKSNWFKIWCADNKEWFALLLSIVAIIVSIVTSLLKFLI